MKKQDFNRYFAVLLTGLSKKHKTGTKILRNAILLALVLAVWNHAAEAGFVNVDYTGSFQYFTVQTTGLYDITAFGAQGGNNSVGDQGGNGAKIGGEFNLTAGDVLKIAVGGAGKYDDGGGGGGGGGGSLVTLVGHNLLVVAGGGGGAGSVWTGGSGGSSGSGTNGSAGSDGIFGAGGAGGLLGAGGSVGSLTGGAGGGYFSSGGINDESGGGGGSFISDDWSGGAGYNNNAFGGAGGFGGGGGARTGGGGGGGYSGGGGGGAGGGGGGSLDNGFNQVLVDGFQSGNGAVDIVWAWSGSGLVEGVVAVPEPSSFAMLAIGGLVLGGYAWRKKQRMA